MTQAEGFYKQGGQVDWIYGNLLQSNSIAVWNKPEEAHSPNPCEAAFQVIVT